MSCRCADFSQAGAEVGGFNAMTRGIKTIPRIKFDAKSAQVNSYMRLVKKKKSNFESTLVI